MVNNKVTIEKDLIQDLRKYASSICTSLASQVRDEMHKEAQYAIEEFYNHYDPLYYNRHYYNFKKNSFEKYYKNPHNSIVRGGIVLTPYALDDLYRADKEYVFNLVYLGFHGNVKMLPHEIHNTPPVMNPSPLDMLIDKRDFLVDNIEDFKDVAINKAQKQQYAFLYV